MLYSFSYPNNPINSLNALSKLLGETPETLTALSIKSSSLYNEISLQKPSGGVRIINAPHEKLKNVQRKINNKILSRINFPYFLHGSIKDLTSPRTPISNTHPHLNKKQIISIDIENFYPSVRKKYVILVFRRLLKFSPHVSEILANLCCYKGVLPQGAPTSSYLSNLLFWDKEKELVNFIEERNGNYSRYIDDITISFHYRLKKNIKKEIIEQCISMVKSKECRISRKKTKVFIRGGNSSGFVITGISVFHKTHSLSKHYRRKVRAEVNQLGKLDFHSTSRSSFYQLYNSVSGKVNRLKQFNHSEYSTLRYKLYCLAQSYNN